MHNVEVVLSSASEPCSGCHGGESLITVPEILQNLETDLADESLDYNEENDHRSKLDIVYLKAVIEGLASQRSNLCHPLIYSNLLHNQ